MLAAARWLRNTGAAAVLSGLVVTSGVVLSTIATADYGQVMATTAVNIRSGPGTSYSVKGVLYQGNSLKQVGAQKSGFVPVSYQGTTAWVSAQYLSGVAGQQPETMISQPSGASTAVTTASYLNVRSAPSTSAARIGLVARGTSLSLTGKVSGSWSQVVYNKQNGWVSTAYLAAPGTSSTDDLSSKITGKGRATTALMIRTTATSNFRSLGDAPTGTIFDLTDVEQNGMKQIVWQGVLRWVNGQYVAPVSSSSTPTAPTLPTTIGTRYATTDLTIRTSSDSTADSLGDIPKGTALPVTGVVKNGRAEVIYQGAVRWVTAQYLSSTAPAATTPSTTTSDSSQSDSSDPWDVLVQGGSSGLDGLQPYAKDVVNYVLSNFTQIRTIYGVRPDSLPDHPSGHAVDLMLPNYTSNNALGWTMANQLRANASSLHIQYIIFDSHIWNISRDSEGWRLMADRGSDTANHVNHVHITVQD